jgi:hypothetical protein
MRGRVCGRSGRHVPRCERQRRRRVGSERSHGIVIVHVITRSSSAAAASVARMVASGFVPDTAAAAAITAAISAQCKRRSCVAVFVRRVIAQLQHVERARSHGQLGRLIAAVKLMLVLGILVVLLLLVVVVVLLLLLLLLLFELGASHRCIRRRHCRRSCLLILMPLASGAAQSRAQFVNAAVLSADQRA